MKRLQLLVSSICLSQALILLGLMIYFLFFGQLQELDFQTLELGLWLWFLASLAIGFLFAKRYFKD